MQRAGVWGLQHDPFYSSNLNPNPIPIPNLNPNPIPNRTPSTPRPSRACARRTATFVSRRSAPLRRALGSSGALGLGLGLALGLGQGSGLRLAFSVSVRALDSSGASRGSNPATLYPCNPTRRRLHQLGACPGWQPRVFMLATLCVQAGAAALYADETCMLPSYHPLQVGAAALHAG